WRPELPLLAETSGKNSIIVTPSADPDLAVKDVAYSAFGHAGQKCSAGSVVILVGSMATSRRFHDQLVDAVRSLHVAWPSDPSSQMGPVVLPDDAKLRRGLTTLGPGENWVLRPRELDSTGALWSPGLRAGVQPGSEYHLTEYFGPILGVMKADTLEEAVRLQNAPEYGLTAGIQSLDPKEVEYWLEHVQAGNLYVNRVITGAIVRRQPFGGWKRSAVGAGAKAGGPNYLFGLGSWEPVPVEPEIAAEHERRIGEVVDLDAPPPSYTPTHPEEGPEEVRAVVEIAAEALTPEEHARLRRAVASDARAWAAEYGVAHDPTGLVAERNVLRYLPTPVTVRVDEGQDLVDLLRVAVAGIRAGSSVLLSTGIRIPGVVTQRLVAAGLTVRHESNAEWLEEAAAWARSEPLGARVRLVGGGSRKLAAAVEGLPDIAIWAGPVTESGRVELLPFLREQAVSITAHRFGTPFRLAEEVL
ncbi:MAG: aldehyde dehydrogenase family protein, partial [Actinobacteria bacterium]|nr:aldehyde dehydrogenase family protein [Actinomycetota bacterium]